MSDDAGTELPNGVGENFGEDGVVDVDVEGGLSIHERQGTGNAGTRELERRGRDRAGQVMASAVLDPGLS